ncbi:MAG: helix-turn-helix domain-containing protein [Rhizobiaceae bacterium]
MTNPRKPSAEDRQHGRELARRRKSLGLSQGEVAAFLEVSTQQYGKYERGENRMSVARFEAIERFLSEKEGGGDGLREAPQATFEAPITKSGLQKSIEQMRKNLQQINATLDLWQRYLDRL